MAKESEKIKYSAVIMEHQFPEGFLWGAATASHQVEGNNQNDWTQWEKQNAERLARESEGDFASWNPHWEQFRKEATDPENYISGLACDHWNRYEEDFDIMQTLGLSGYRFSLEWSRIEPQKGVFDEQSLTHYQEMLRALRERGITPFVTLWHWTLPLWLRDEGGLLSRNFADYFAHYTEQVVRALGSDLLFVVTLNEPDVVASHAYLKGVWPPQEKSVVKFLSATRHLVAAHRKAYEIIKKNQPTIRVGIAKHQVYFERATATLWNTLLKSIADSIWNRWWLNRIKNHQDFIGLNHYNRNLIDGWYNKNPNDVQTDFGWEFYPESLEFAIRELMPYGKPIYITENGLADAKDTLRVQFIPRALHALQRAIQGGADVRGYLHWSLLDNFEWDKGYWLRFGLIAIDRPALGRTIRPSAQKYAEIARKNALN